MLLWFVTNVHIVYHFLWKKKRSLESHYKNRYNKRVSDKSNNMYRRIEIEKDRREYIENNK